MAAASDSTREGATGDAKVDGNNQESEISIAQGTTDSSADVELAERTSEGATIKEAAVDVGKDSGGDAPDLARTNTEDAAPVPVYKVYKRRWFGLVQLTLLNVIVSWDVS